MYEQEFTVRIPPRNEKKNYHIMKFNANMNVDVGKWTQVSKTVGIGSFYVLLIRGVLAGKFPKFEYLLAIIHFKSIYRLEW